MIITDESLLLHFGQCVFQLIGRNISYWGQESTITFTRLPGFKKLVQAFSDYDGKTSKTRYRTDRGIATDVEGIGKKELWERNVSVRGRNRKMMTDAKYN